MILTISVQLLKILHFSITFDPFIVKKKLANKYFDEGHV